VLWKEKNKQRKSIYCFDQRRWRKIWMWIIYKIGIGFCVPWFTLRWGTQPKRSNTIHRDPY